jgi:hypothetical protein
MGWHVYLKLEAGGRWSCSHPRQIGAEHRHSARLSLLHSTTAGKENLWADLKFQSWGGDIGVSSYPAVWRCMAGLR